MREGGRETRAISTQNRVAAHLVPFSVACRRRRRRGVGCLRQEEEEKVPPQDDDDEPRLDWMQMSPTEDGPKG